MRSSERSEDFGRSDSEVGYACVRRPREGRVTIMAKRFAWRQYQFTHSFPFLSFFQEIPKLHLFLKFRGRTGFDNF